MVSLHLTPPSQQDNLRGRGLSEAMINSMYALCEPWHMFLEGFHDFEVCIGGDGGSGSIAMTSVIGLLF